MWWTPDGKRILQGAEARLFREALAMIVDMVREDAWGFWQFDAPPFDKLQPNQKLAAVKVSQVYFFLGTGRWRKPSAPIASPRPRERPMEGTGQPPAAMCRQSQQKATITVRPPKKIDTQSSPWKRSGRPAASHQRLPRRPGSSTGRRSPARSPAQPRERAPGTRCPRS